MVETSSLSGALSAAFGCLFGDALDDLALGDCDGVFGAFCGN